MLRNYGERARFEHVLRGRNSRLDALQAAILSVKLPFLDAWNDRRRTISATYSRALADTPLRVPAEAGHEDVHHLYVVEAADRDGFRAALAQAGVETAVHYPRAVHLQPAYEALGTGRELRVSEQLAATVVSLPMYPELTDGEVELVAEAARSAGLEQPGVEIADV
jgi:dTDP-3-amino-3,4,6-trideoxy-alpha-D-glucose transaminase